MLAICKSCNTLQNIPRALDTDVKVCKFCGRANYGYDWHNPINLNLAINMFIGLLLSGVVLMAVIFFTISMRRV